jgi:aromatic ring-opening dioxygenase LigB subunit
MFNYVKTKRKSKLSQDFGELAPKSKNRKVMGLSKDQFRKEPVVFNCRDIERSLDTKQNKKSLLVSQDESDYFKDHYLKSILIINQY